MARRVFFSFHYDDVSHFRANVVRNHWLTKPDSQVAGFFDASLWEKAKGDSTVALKRLINGGLQNTSATCVLIGSDTANRPWVRYEIFKSMLRGNVIVGVHVNSIPGSDRQTKPKGANPFGQLAVAYSSDGQQIELLQWNIGTAWTQFTEIESTAWHARPSHLPKLPRQVVLLSQLFPTRDWASDDGYRNFAAWIDEQG